jgi:hypothetical protein
MMRVSKFILILSVILSGFTPFISGQAPLFQTKSMSFNNSVASVIAPVIFKDGMIFCSDRRTSSLTGTTTFKDERLYNIYYVERKDSSEWGPLQPIKSSTNPVLYYGPLCIAPDGKTVYFTSGQLSGRAARRPNARNLQGIYKGELSGTDIVNVTPFEYNNPKYNLAYPSVSKDGKYLFFASDMPGGLGKTDIYYCEWINNKWSTPVNPGSKVNSASVDDYPFIHSSGRLYFSSERPSGLGGRDIYYSSLSFGNWEDPVHLPADVNSPYDDFALVADESLQKGYFASNRNRGTDNIFSFSSTIIHKVKCDTMVINNYCYEFYDQNLRNDSVPFKYTWNFGDGTKADGFITDHCFAGPGKYIVTLDVVNLITKEILKNEKTINLDLTAAEQPYISAPDMGNAGKQISLNADSTNLPGWNIKLYYWNFGDESVMTGKVVDHTFLKPGVFNVQLIVTSEPDSAGVVKEACVFKNINVIR